MFHVKRSREGGDVSRETKEGGVPVFGGGLPSLPPADLAFSLLFCPHPPDPRSQSALPGGKGELFVLFCRGLAPPAPLRLSPGGTGYFLPCQCFFVPIPPTPFPAGRGGDQGYFMQGAPPLASPGLNPGGTGSIGGAGAPGTPATKPARHWLFSAISVLFAPIPPTPFPCGEGGGFCFILPGGSAPAPLRLSPGSTDIPSGRNHLNITGSTLVNAYL